MNEIKRSQNASKWREIDALRHQSVGQLRVKYLEVFGLESRSNHKQFLVRRIAWRLQANAEFISRMAHRHFLSTPVSGSDSHVAQLAVIQLSGPNPRSGSD